MRISSVQNKNLFLINYFGSCCNLLTINCICSHIMHFCLLFCISCFLSFNAFITSLLLKLSFILRVDVNKHKIIADKIKNYSFNKRKIAFLLSFSHFDSHFYRILINITLFCIRKTAILTRKIAVLHRKITILTRKITILHRKIAILTRKIAILTRKIAILLRKIAIPHRKVSILLRKITILHRKIAIQHRKLNILLAKEVIFAANCNILQPCIEKTLKTNKYNVQLINVLCNK